MGYEQKNKKKSTRVSSCVRNVSYGVRLIDSPAERLEPAAPISESVLSDSNGLRRHFRVAVSRYFRNARPESAVDFAPLRFGPRRGGKTSKSEGFLLPSETSGFATLVVSP